MRNKKRSNGFTLIELLVVISIIAMLLSIIMPALSSAKMKAKRTVCQSNLKQMHLVASMYAIDNRSYFPRKTLQHNADTYVYFSSLYPSSDSRYLWEGYMPDYKLVQVGEEDDRDFAPKVMYCPNLNNKTTMAFGKSWPSPNLWGDGNNIYMIGYNYFNLGELIELRSTLTWEGSADSPERETVSGNVPLFGDLLIYNYDFASPVYRIANHFRGGAKEFVFETGSILDRPIGANNVHVDGSAEWYKYQDEMEPYINYPTQMQRNYWGSP